MTLFYRDDLHGYDDLFTFADLFPTYELWKDRVGSYMYDIEVDSDARAEKIYMNLFNVYKNHFFRFATMPKIFTEIAGRLTVLYAELEVGSWIKENSSDIAGTSTINENYRTNNTAEESDPENNTRYRTDINTSKVDNGTVDLELRDRVANNANRIQNFITDMRPMFMNKTNEIVIKELYGK